MRARQTGDEASAEIAPETDPPAAADVLAARERVMKMAAEEASESGL